MIYGQGGTKELTKNIEVPLEDRQQFCLNDDERSSDWPHSLSP